MPAKEAEADAAGAPDDLDLVTTGLRMLDTVPAAALLSPAAGMFALESAAASAVLPLLAGRRRPLLALGGGVLAVPLLADASTRAMLAFHCACRALALRFTVGPPLAPRFDVVRARSAQKAGLPLLLEVSLPEKLESLSLLLLVLLLLLLLMLFAGLLCSLSAPIALTIGEVALFSRDFQAAKPVAEPGELSKLKRELLSSTSGCMLLLLLLLLL